MKQNDSRASKTGVWRRLLSVVLAVCMVISMTPAVIAEDSPAATAENTPIVTTSPEVVTSPEVTTPAEPVTQATEPAEPAPTEPTVTDPVPEVTTPTDPVPEVTTPTEPVPEVTDPTEPVPEEPVPDSEQVELIKQLISALPFEVTEENSEEVRLRLQDILNLYSQLTPAEQEAVDITPCFMLQAQLDEIDSAQTLEETPGITVDENGVTTININEVTDEHVWIKEDGVYIIEGNGTEAKKSIEVYPNISPTITLRNVNIKSPNETYPPFSAGFDSSGTVTIILEGDNILTTYGAYREYHSALQMSSGLGASGKPTGKLIIKEGSSGGSLTAIGSSNAFGIGSPATEGYYTNDIIIESGTIIAKCNKGTAGGGGIGGIDCDITINGGTIKAYTNENYAFPCIGTVGGGSVDGGSVTINGGNIKAEKSGFGACIGGQNNSCTVTITGGTINATNTNVGTCIGSSGSNNIKITGGIINAIGAKNAIGCGISNNAVGTIEISGGVVNAATTATEGSGVGIGGGNMTFTTGTNGHAIINASSISDQSGKNSWSGVILEGDTWTVYGIPTVTDSFTVEAGQTLTVEDGKTLTLGSDANGNNITVTNDGVIAIEYGGTINGNGIITGSGSFTTENLTEDMIILPADLAYNGKDRSSEISANISYGTAAICGQKFTFDSSKWKVNAVTTTDNYNYMVEFVYNDTETKTFSVSLAQSGTEFAEGSVATYKNNMAAAEFAYGETVTVKAKPVPTGEAPAMAVSTFSLTEPTASQMALYYNDVQISEPVEADANGLYTMTVPVSELINAGAGYDTPVTLTAKFIGDEKMADSEATVNVTLHRAQLTASATIADKVYDGTNTAAVSSVTFTDSDGNTVELGEADYTAAAEFEDANAGENKPATVTVTLSENLNYTLTESTVNATGTVTARALTENDITVTLDNETYTWAGVEIKPIPTLTWDNNGTPVTIDPSDYVVSYSNNGGEGSSFGFDKTPEVCITAKEGGNYSFNVIYRSFTITCNHNFGVTGGYCNGCGKQADVEVTDGTTSQGYFDTTDAPIDKTKLEEIIKNADAQSGSSGNPVTVKLYSGWTVPSDFVLKVNDKINFVADENQEFKAGSIIRNSPAAELTLDTPSGTFSTTSSWEGAKFTLNNGTITQNVSLSDNNSFIMNGGTVGYISDTAKTAPSSVTITGGTVRKTLTALPTTNLTVTGGTIGELMYNGTGAVTNTKLSGGSFAKITLPDGEPVGSILAAGYAFYNAADNTEVADTSVNTLSNVFVAKAGSHVVSADLDFTGEVEYTGDLETDGYHWESIPSAADESRMICTLTLKDCIVPGNIALPDNAESITINLQGESSVGGFVSTRGPKYGDEYQYPQYAYNMKITGNGSLAIGGILGGSGADHNQITIDSGANVTVSGDVQYGASGGVNGVLTVNGSLTVNSQSYAAIYGGRLVIGASGNLSVSGARGVNLNGSNASGYKDFTNAFVIAEGGSFTADCRDSNIIVNAIPGLTEQQIASVFSIPDYYLPDGYSVRYASNEYSGVLTIVPETVSDAAILSCTGMGGQMKLKYQPYTAEVNPAAYDYTGSAIIPTVVVTNITDGATIDPANYTVTAKNNTLPGTATATIQGIGEYDFTITRTFEINCTHTAGNKDTGVCSICHKQMAVGAIRYNYSTQRTECRFFDDLVDAWNYALDNSCDNLLIYADVTVAQVLEIPAGKELYLNVKNNKTLTGTADSTIDVYGTLVLGEGTIKNANNCSIRVYADADEYDHTVFKMDEQNKTVDGVEVYGTGKVELRACRVTDHITVREGRTVKELLYVESTYKSADGWLTEEALNATTLRGPVDIVDAPVAFQTGFTESKLNPEYKQGSNAEPLFARLYSTDIPAVQLQWYTIVDGTETPIEGATELTYTPSVAEVGVTQYFCQGTLDGYTARSEIFTVTVIKNVTVALTSKLTGDDSGVTIGNLTGGGEYTSGDSVTVTAPAVDGCAFDGWYDGETLASPNLSYTFTAADDVSLAAKYTANAKATVTIEGLNNARFYVNNNTTVQTTCTEGAAIGSKIVLTAVEPEKVSAWLNGSNKIIGTGASIELTVTGNMTVKLMYKADTDNQAMVEYVSDYGQLLSYKSYSADQEIDVPVAPSKLGCTFAGWSLTAAQIKEEIKAGTKHITVTPVYTQNDTTFTVTVKYGDGTSETQAVAQGSGFTAVAKSIDGKVFTCWTDSDNKILSYEPNYLIRVSSDVTLIAVYANEPVKAKPVIAITDKFASVVNNKNKVSFTATRSVSEMEYQIIEHGIIYTTNSEQGNEAALVLDGTNVRKVQSSDMSVSGVYTLNFTVGEYVDNKLYVRGYMIVHNLQTNNIETIYSLVDSGSFNELK